MPAVTHLAPDEAVVVVYLNLESEAENSQHDEVTGDDPMVMAEVLPARPSTI